MKRIAIVLALIITISSAAGIYLETRYRNDIQVQRLFSRFSTLANDRILETANSLRQKGTPESLQQAISLYRDAISRDPKNPFRWCDLGLALAESKEIEEARSCYEQAAKLGPNKSETLWKVVDFYQHIGEPQKALRYASHILEIDNAAAGSMFYQYLETGFDFGDTLRFGIPRSKPIAQAYMRYVIRNGNMDKAALCWDWISSLSFVDDQLIAEYLAFLIRIGNPAKAWNTWIGYTHKGTEANLVYNSSFESVPTKSPFDWNISRIAGVEVERDSGIRHEGAWSLKITFDGKENPAYRHVSQNVFLEAGTYHFGGFLRAEGITSDKGIAFRIGSFQTDQVTGSCDWKELEQAFEIREPSLIRVEVFRRASERFANKIAGNVWIDDLTLTKLTKP